MAIWREFRGLYNGRAGPSMIRVRPGHLSANEGNISAWAARLRNRGFTTLAQRLITMPNQEVQLLRELQLPQYDHRLLSCSDFMRDFQFHKRTFVHESYYLTLFPTRWEGAKFSVIGLRSLNDALAFVRDHVLAPFDSQVVYLSELRTNIFGGSLLCDGQTVIAEDRSRSTGSSGTWDLHSPLGDTQSDGHFYQVLHGRPSYPTTAVALDASDRPVLCGVSGRRAARSSIGIHSRPTVPDRLF
jgi:hypothetical protein